EGNKFVGKPAAFGEQQSAEYNTKRYHQPSDEYTDAMDFSSNVKLAKFGIALGWKAAEQPKLVEWLAGDEFEAARKASRSKQ
ncbi:MAG: peptidase M28, partial [Terriglobales bacterium]